MTDSQRRWAMTCLVLGVILGTLDAAIANIALPTMMRELHTSDSGIVWVVNSYQLAAVVALLPAAAMGEAQGLKRVYGLGLVVFTAASLGCALSGTLGWLIAARIAQGIGGSLMTAVAPALVRTIYPRPLISRGFALIALAVAIAAATGPTIAATILSIASWPWLFLVNLPVGLVTIPLFYRITPATPGQARRFDVVGALLSTVALGLTVVGVDGLGGHERGLALAELALGLIGFVVLVRQQRGRANPLLPLDLLRIPLFALSIGTSICSYCAQILAYVSLPFLFQTVMHYSPVATGLLVTPWPLLVAAAAPLSGRLAARYPAALLGSIGLAVLTAGLLLLVTMPDMPANWNIAWRMGLCGIGFGFFQTPNNTTLMIAGPVARSGAASGMIGVARTVGWVLGSALVALIFGLAGVRGTTACLTVAACVAALGAVLSSARGLGGRSAAAR